MQAKGVYMFIYTRTHTLYENNVISVHVLLDSPSPDPIL